MRQLTTEDRARLERRQSLELARTQALAELKAATLPAHQKMLTQKIAALEAQIGALR